MRGTALKDNVFSGAYVRNFKSCTCRSGKPDFLDEAFIATFGLFREWWLWPWNVKVRNPGDFRALCSFRSQPELVVAGNFGTVAAGTP